MRSAIGWSFVAAIVSSVGAQGSTHVHPTSGTTGIDPAYYVSAAQKATARLETPDSARAAGYVPVFGNAPLQGEHYARPDLVMRDSFDVNRPSVLMFARVGTETRLVGVAYTFYLPVDRMTPRGWTGPADVWHAHDDLARIPGKHIVMMHTWFIESPFGTLAHDNPWLPYLAAGIAPPPLAVARDSSAMALVRRVGLALELATAPPALMEQIHRSADPLVGIGITLARVALGSGLTRLRDAEAGGDSVASNKARVELAARGDSLVVLYREGAGPTPALRDGLAVLIDMYLGGGRGRP